MGIGSSIKSSIGAIFFGILLILGSICVIWWNEGRTIKTHEGLQQGSEEVHSSLTPTIISPENEGKLIHISGTVLSKERLSDSDFGIDVEHLKLKRTVKMYQWKENKSSSQSEDSKETTTTYTYSKEWSENVYNSTGFNEPDHHSNPNGKQFKSYSKSVSQASLGAHELNTSQIRQLGDWTSFKISEISDHTGGILHNSEGTRSTIYIGNSSLENPQIGDLKITYQAVNSGDYSIVAKQIGQTFEAFKTSKGTEIHMIKSGVHSAQEMFQNAISQNKMFKWLLRGGGFILMFIGIRMLFSLITLFTNKIPLVGSIIHFGISIFSGVVAFCISFITAGIAWVFYRPFLGITLLIIGIGVLVFFSRKGKRVESGY